MVKILRSHFVQLSRSNCQGLKSVYVNASQRVISIPAASPENLLEIQFVGPALKQLIRVSPKKEEPHVLTNSLDNFDACQNLRTTVLHKGLTAIPLTSFLSSGFFLQ